MYQTGNARVLPLPPPLSFTLRSPTSLPACRLFVFNLVLMPSSIIVKIITLNVNAESESKQQPSKGGTGGEATQYAGNGKNVRQQRASWLKRGREREGWGEWQWEKTRAAQQENGKYVSSGYKEKWVHGSGRWFKRVVIIKFYTYIHTHSRTHKHLHTRTQLHTHTHTRAEHNNKMCEYMPKRHVLIPLTRTHTYTGRRTNTHTHMHSNCKNFMPGPLKFNFYKHNMLQWQLWWHTNTHTSHECTHTYTDA